MSKKPAVGIPLACEHMVWMRPPLPNRSETLWCVKCQCDVPIGGKHTQRTHFEDWYLEPTRRGYRGTCNECPYTHLLWDFYVLRTHMEAHYITEHVNGRLADALRDVKAVAIPTKNKDLPPPF